MANEVAREVAQSGAVGVAETLAAGRGAPLQPTPKGVGWNEVAQNARLPPVWRKKAAPKWRTKWRSKRRSEGVAA